MRIKSIAKISACASLLTIVLSGCSTARYWWQYYDGSVETSLREPTGYYEHTSSRELKDQLVVPNDLNTPIVDNSLSVPVPTNLAQGFVGAKMDIRPPQVTTRSDLGITGQYNEREAIIWFQSYGHHGIKNEQQAYALIERVLNKNHIQIAERAADAFEMVTAAADFNEFGKSYDSVSAANNGLRYRQQYRIRIGRNDNGDIGIATALLGSQTMLSGGRNLSNTLSEVEIQRFATGFSNSIIETLQSDAEAAIAMPQVVTVTLDRDNNSHMALFLDSDYDTTFNVLKEMLPKYNIEISEYSVSHSDLKIDVSEEDASFYRNKGVDPFLLASGDYIIRLGVVQDKVVITFFDEDDKPLSDEIVTRLYSGFSKALTLEFQNYNR